MESNPRQLKKQKQPLQGSSEAPRKKALRLKRTKTSQQVKDPPEKETDEHVHLPPQLARLERIFGALCSFLGLFELQRRPAKAKMSELCGISTSFSAVVASVNRITGESLELIDLAAIHELAPQLTAIESRLAFVDYDPQFDDDWARPKASSATTFLHAARPHVLYSASMENEARKVLNIYFLLKASNEPAQGDKPIKPRAKKKIDLIGLTQSRQKAFHDACVEYFRKVGGPEADLFSILQLASRSHLPDAVFVDKAPCPKPQEVGGTLSSAVSELFKASFFMGQVDFKTSIQHVAARAPTFLSLEFILHPHVVPLLPEKGLYSHQASSIDALSTNQGIAISTSTASGKSLIYQLAILDHLVQHGGRALLIAPTKALAQDQLASFRRLVTKSSALDWIEINTYDGDTPPEIRAKVRKTSQIVITNPDMLHYSILPQSSSTWGCFISSMTFLVLDEMHVYHGSFGQHTALVMRRLLRLTSDLKIIGCSATISNPAEHLSRLTGLARNSLAEITNDGSPSGPKKIILWNSSRCARPLVTDSVEVLAHFLQAGTSTLAFCQSRNVCETLHSQLKAYLELRLPSALASAQLAQVESYRGGYSPEDRREIEKGLSHGKLKLVIATNALELGIDVGGLDVVVSVGSLADVACLQQQMGRAGRRGNESLMLLLHGQALGDASDQKHFLKSIAGESPCRTLLPDEPDPHLLELHLQCAANERPIMPELDKRWFGPQLIPLCDQYLETDGGEEYICAYQHRSDPTRRIQLRGAAQKASFQLVDASQTPHQLLEELEIDRAIYSVYDEAIYLHRGKRYLVKQVHPKAHRALLVDASDSLHQTTPIRHAILSHGLCLASRHLTKSSFHLGTVCIKNVYTGLKRIHPRSREILEEITYPPHQDSSLVVNTPCMWIDLPALTNASAIAHLVVRSIHTTLGSLSHNISSACCSLTEIDLSHNFLDNR
ncbi:ATP-dependent 3'-5' DNA helicase, variant 2 [Entomophthora muscae]|nr:ATP-dependent 3'-5' DNA helicase, variant 2 [Entomophthora muscae]